MNAFIHFFRINFLASEIPAITQAYSMYVCMYVIRLTHSFNEKKNKKKITNNPEDWILTIQSVVKIQVSAFDWSDSFCLSAICKRGYFVLLLLCTHSSSSSSSSTSTLFCHCPYSYKNPKLTSTVKILCVSFIWIKFFFAKRMAINLVNKKKCSESQTIFIRLLHI